MLRTLIHYRRTHAAVVAGTAVAAAVLTGALLVGDSVRGSLRDLAREGLGEVDHALVGERFVPEDLVDRLEGSEAWAASFETAAPAILLRGDARHPSSGARASDVQIQGADGRLLSLMDGAPEAADLFGDSARSVFPPVAINRSLARELGVESGDSILLSLGRWSDIPAASLLGRRDTENVVEVLRLQVHAVLPDRGAGRFSLQPHQSQPLVAWVPLDALQRELDQPGHVNSILVAARPGHEDESGAEELAGTARGVLELDDLGLELVDDGSWFRLESERFVLGPRLEEAVRDVAAGVEARVFAVSTYLANTIARELPPDSAETVRPEIPYSTIAALDPADAALFGGLVDREGEPVGALDDGEIVLDQWSAEELGAAPGDRIEVSWWDVAPDESLREASATLRLRAIVPKEGLAADPELTQEYPGIADADRMSEWDPPFPVDLGRVRTGDEEYWEQWRGTPKAFVPLGWGRESWGTIWGDLTQLRIEAPEDRKAAVESALRDELPTRVEGGFRFEAVRARAIDAASGTTDFGQLFLGFSFFLIGAAALLVGQLFRLGVEQRASEIGLRLAVGFPPRAVRRELLLEGLSLATVGALLGVGGAVLYAGAMIAGLRTLWQPAVGTTELALHVPPQSLVLGAGISILVVLWVVHRAVRRVGEVPVPRLLAGRSSVPDLRPGRTSRRVALVAFPVAALALALGATLSEGLPPAAFFVAGPALLVGFLALLSLRLDRLPGGGIEAPRSRALLHLAAGNAARHRGRSVLAATAIAAASFILVTVAAFRHDFSSQDPDEIPGTGGFRLVAEAEIALQRSLADPDDRSELGLGEATASALDGARIVSLARRPGDDASCLNLYRPEQPRILGAPLDAMRRTSFAFAGTVDEPAVETPWDLLSERTPDGAIPVFGDVNSTQWILKLGLGDELEMPGDDGRPLRLRLVGTFETSIFQSELLMSRELFREVFPDRTGDAVFLLDVDDSADLAANLERDLAAYGLDVTRTVDRLADFHTVQNTYLSTFQLLGGLGLLLGTVGLAFVILRNVLERRGELATLRALGFRRGTLVGVVVLENTLLLLGGLLSGATAALVTAAPQLIRDPAHLPWGGLAWTLGAVLAAGLVSCLLAASGSVREDLTPVLKAEA